MAYQNTLTALADPTRRNIFEALRYSPKTVGEIARGQPISRPAVSQHLKILLNAKLVSVQPKGNRHLYWAEREGLNELKLYLDGFWSDVLSTYSDEISKRNNEEDKL